MKATMVMIVEQWVIFIVFFWKMDSLINPEGSPFDK